MDNDALKYIIGQAISNIIARTREEYASLSDIYKEVAIIKNIEMTSGVEAQICARLQECCSQYDNYLGKDNFFQTKEKQSGLWKNRITGEAELTPYILNLIHQYPGIDTITLKEKLYEMVNLTPGDKAISSTRNGEMKIDQIMRNFVSHKDSHKEIRFDKSEGNYKMYYLGDDDEIETVDLYENLDPDDVVYDIVSEEDEEPVAIEDKDVVLSFVDDDLVAKEKNSKSNKIYIRKNDIDTWIKREKGRVENGNIAERLVYVSEQLKLRELNRDDLADKVKWISRDSGDGFGYDIQSYDLDETGKEYEIHIEVKSTKNINDDFIMSKNEYEYAKEHKDTYRLYRVGRVKTNSPVCKVINVDLDDVFVFEPNEYKVSVKRDE